MTMYEAIVTLYGVPMSTTHRDLISVLQRARTIAHAADMTVYVQRRNPLREHPRVIATIGPSGECTYTSDVLGEELTEILSVFPDAVDAREEEEK